MKQFHIISLFPEMIQNFFQEGVVARASKKELISLEVTNPRDFTHDIHNTVDDKPFGGGDGMVLKPEPITESITSAKQGKANPYVIYLSPQGNLWNDQRAKSLAKDNRDLVLICGRYAGLDQRVIDAHVDEEISIGDYVLSGGELGACVLIDSIARQIPGVLGHNSSAEEDSFKDGLLEGPQYTRPKEFEGQLVPEVLLNGDHKKIAEIRRAFKIIFTYRKRPDLFKASDLTKEDYEHALAQVLTHLGVHSALFTDK